MKDSYTLPRPDTLAILTQIIAVWRDQHPGQHDGLPAHNQEAAKLWLHIQEKPQRGEAPTIKKKSSGGQYWETPYLTRITQRLCKFLTHGDEEKAYIVSAGKAGIPWRDDDMDFFKRVVEQTELMREMGLTEYRKMALTKMSSLNFTMPSPEKQPVREHQQQPTESLFAAAIDEMIAEGAFDKFR